MTESKWLIHGRQASQAPLRLFCFPYAGGGASIYRRWGERLAGVADVYAVQLPGREERIRDPRFYSIQRLVTAFIAAHGGMFSQPFALFGHSMGAKIVFELSLRLTELGHAPRLVMVSASRAPASPTPRQIHSLPEAEFIEELRHLAGTPEEILREKAFMDMFLPLLRADFTMDETYMEHAVLDLPAVVIGGTEDSEANEEDLACCCRQFAGPCTRHIVPGGHFFIREKQDELLGIVRAELLKIRP